MKDEEGRRIAAIEGFNVAEKRINELNTKLTEANREKKNVEAALGGAERQAEAQRKQLRQVEDELATTKDQTKVLKKKLKDAEKARDQAEQDGYDVRVAKTEKALKAEVSGVCRTYCLQVWNEALNLAKVKAFSALRRVENVYYPLQSEHQTPQSPRMMQPLRIRAPSMRYRPKTFLLLAVLQKGQSKLAQLRRKKRTQKRSPLKLQSLQLHPRILPRGGGFPKP